jgi:hypothetical protein
MEISKDPKATSRAVTYAFAQSDYRPCGLLQDITRNEILYSFFKLVAFTFVLNAVGILVMGCRYCYINYRFQ